MPTSPLPGRATILVVIQGTPADPEVVRLACRLAHEWTAQLRAVYAIHVPPSVPLTEWRGEAFQQAREAVARASAVAQAMGSDLRVSILPTRDAGQAIVDEAAEWSAELVVLEMPSQPGRRAIVTQVLMAAVCAVVVYRPAPASEARERTGAAGP
jgi:K+-sensing histidine kinase KdpD